jgi:transcriptional regulator with XRE-family HTH domain
MEIKEILKLERKKRNLTQKEIAGKLNIERAAYATYETGKNTPTTENIIKLAKIYNVTTDYLLGLYTDEMYK